MPATTTMDGILRRVTWGHSRGLHASAGVECDDAAANVEPAYTRSSGNWEASRRRSDPLSEVLLSMLVARQGGKISFLTPRTLNSRVVWPVHLTLRRHWTPSTHSIVHGMTVGYGMLQNLLCTATGVKTTRSTAPNEMSSCVPVFLCSRPARRRFFSITRCNLYILYKNPQSKTAPRPLGSRVPAMAICTSSPCPCSQFRRSQVAAGERPCSCTVLWQRFKYIIIPRLHRQIQGIEMGRPRSCCSVGLVPTHHHCDPSANPRPPGSAELTGRMTAPSKNPHTGTKTSKSLNQHTCRVE